MKRRNVMKYNLKHKSIFKKHYRSVLCAYFLPVCTDIIFSSKGVKIIKLEDHPFCLE